MRNFWGNAAKDGWDRIKFSECWFQVTRKMQLENHISSLPCFPIYWKLVAKNKSARCKRLGGYKRTEPGKFCFLWIKEKYSTWECERERRTVRSLLWADNPGGRGSLSSCKDALWRSGRTRRSCRGGLELANCISKCSSALGVNPGSLSLPTAGAGKGSGSPAAAGGAGLAPGREINLLPFNFYPKLDQQSDTLLTTLN